MTFERFQHEIDRFVAIWGPEERTGLRPIFIDKLQWLLDTYAELAIEQGCLPPEVLIPDKPPPVSAGVKEGP